MITRWALSQKVWAQNIFIGFQPKIFSLVIKHILNAWIELPLLHIVFKDALQKILRVYGGLCIYVWQPGRGIKGDQS